MTFLLNRRPVQWIGLFLVIIVVTVDSSNGKEDEIEVISHGQINDKVTIDESTEGSDENDSEVYSCSKNDILAVSACKRICGSAGDKNRDQDFCVDTNRFDGVVCDCPNENKGKKNCNSDLSVVFKERIEDQEDCAAFCRSNGKIPFGCQIHVDREVVPVCSCFVDPQSNIKPEKRGSRVPGGNGGKGKGKNKRPNPSNNKTPSKRPVTHQTVQVNQATENEQAPQTQTYPDKPTLDRLKLFVDFIQSLVDAANGLSKTFPDITQSIQGVNKALLNNYGVINNRVPDDKKPSDDDDRK